jgi:RNA polymerase sigma-70 factor (ECF subfamily)
VKGEAVSRTQAEILASACRGDVSAFAQLVEDLRAPLISYLLGIVGTRDPAEEMAQEVFCRAWQHLPRIRKPDRLVSWLYQTAHNLAVSALRRPRLAALPEDLPARATTLPPDEHGLALHRAVGQLSEPFRSTVALRHFSGMSHGQIAEYLGVPEGTVRSRLSRAYAQLRKTLGPLMEE